MGSWLYTGTFGTLIGLAVAFPMLLATQFPHSHLVRYAFVGPLLGALIRPLGGWLADRMGGASLTFWNFGIMAVAIFGVLLYLPADDISRAAPRLLDSIELACKLLDEVRAGKH